MAAQLPVQELIDKFLADNRMLAGSRDGYPALALSLNQVRDLADYVESIHKQRGELLSLIYNYAIGEVAMGMSPSFEDLAQSAYQITGISNGDIEP